MTAILDFAPCSLIEIDRHLASDNCLHHQGGPHYPGDEGSKHPETSANIHGPTLHRIP